MKNYTTIVLSVFIISQIALSSLILSLSNRAQKQRIQAQESQQVTEGYLRCIFLAKFDYPEAVKPNSTRQQVEEALDGCAKSL